MKAGAKAAVILPDILRLSHSNNGTTRSIAASILGSVGDSRPEVVHRLNQLATERYSDSRRRAIQSLGQLGTGAKSATPTLVDIAANTSGTQEGYDAIWALIQINNSSPEVVSTLKAIHGKRGPSEQKRFAAVALVSLGEPAENFIRDLHYLLENDSAGARKFASIAATQMLTVDPEHQGAKALIAREEQNAKFNEAMKIEAQRRAESR